MNGKSTQHSQRAGEVGTGTVGEGTCELPGRKNFRPAGDPSVSKEAVMPKKVGRHPSNRVEPRE